MPHSVSLPTAPIQLWPPSSQCQPIQIQSLEMSLSVWPRQQSLITPIQHSAHHNGGQMNEWVMVRPNQHMAYPICGFSGSFLECLWHCFSPNEILFSLCPLSPPLTIVRAVIGEPQIHNLSELRWFRLCGQVQWAGREVDPYWLHDQCPLPCSINRIAGSYLN